MIKHLTLDNGTKLPVRLAYTAMKYLKEETGQDVVRLTASSFNFASLEVLLFHGLRSGHKAEGKEMPYTRDQMEDLLDEVFNEFVSIIPSFFPKPQANQKKTTPQ